MDVLQRIAQIVEGNQVVLFMKGTRMFPQCGYSSRASAALYDVCKDAEFFDVFSDIEVYENLPKYADWHTFPQLYINGELIGGCDILMELHGNGELKEMINAAAQA